jgi:aromatic ring-cleaving dioxygenase
LDIHPLAEIASYHAHIYFAGPDERIVALALRDRIAERFTVSLGRVHDRLVGPHTRAMYQISFDVATFAKLVPWLMINRQGLAVLIHPNTGRERADHLTHSLWLGEMLPLVNMEMLAEETKAEAARAPNTTPTLTP